MTDELRKKIAAGSLISCGEGIDWAGLFAKKSIRIGWLGGSVTQGYANGEIRWQTAFPALVAEDLRAKGLTVDCDICAEAGMDSLICGVLAGETVLSHKPDLVFLEFAINDTTLRHNVHSFESLLRRLLTMDKPPVVCLLLMRSASGYSCESFMLPMAEHYGLPCINLRPGLEAAMSAGEMQWGDFADNESHPHPAGHRLLADCVLHLLDAAKHSPQSKPRPLPEPWLEAPFMDMQRLSPGEYACIETAAPVVQTGEWYFPAAWELTEGCGMTLRLTCTAVVVYFEAHRLPEYGSCRVLVDGVPMREPLRSNSIYGWGNPRHMIVLQAEEAGAHTIELQAFDGIFRVLALGVCPEQGLGSDKR